MAARKFLICLYACSVGHTYNFIFYYMFFSNFSFLSQYTTLQGLLKKESDVLKTSDEYGHFSQAIYYI